MSLESQRPTTDIEWRRNFASDLFHRLSQPLTALQCSLDLSLRGTRTAEEYKATIVTALELTQRLVRISDFAREANLADDPGVRSAVDVSALLTEMADEFEPVAESKRIRFERRSLPASSFSAIARTSGKLCFSCSIRRSAVLGRTPHSTWN